MKLSKFVYVVEGDEYIAFYNFLNSKLILISDKEDIDLLNVFIKTGESFDTPVFRELSTFDVIIDSDYDEDMLLEYKMKNYLYNNERLEITIIPGQLCNFNCTYCYESDKPVKITSGILEGLKHLIHDLVDDSRYKECRIFWFGGEPTLYPEIVTGFMNSLKMDLQDTLISGSMTTNGYLLNVENFIKYFECGIDSFQITIDGFEEEHNKHRHLKNGNGTWEHIINNLSEIQKLNKQFTVLIRINYNEEMIDSIFGFIDFIKEKFDNRFVIHTHPIFNGDSDKPYSEDMCDPALEQYIRMEVIDFVTENEVKTDLPILLTSFGSQICYAARPNSFVIDEYGNIRKCTVALDHEYNVVGHINESGEYNLNLYKLSKWIESRMRNEKCNNCECLPACYRVGGCPKMFFEGIPDCSINKHMAEYFVERMISHLLLKSKLSPHTDAVGE